MRKSIVILALIALFVPALSAQKVAVGLFGGVSNYWGELNDNQIIWDETHAAVGALLRYEVNPFVSLRFALSSATISGSDVNFPVDRIDPNTGFQNSVRNLSFRSQITELAGIVEINATGYDVEDRRFSPFIFGGVAGFHHNPRALFEGTWHDLQPLGTEGQGTTAFPNRSHYSRFQASFPFGAGFKVGLGSGLTLGVEAGMRYTLTDYLDDISTTYVDASVQVLESGDLSWRLSNRTGEVLGQPLDLGNNDRRGNPDDTDWYMMAGVSLTYTIGVPIGSKGSKRGCPYNF